MKSGSVILVAAAAALRADVGPRAAALKRNPDPGGDDAKAETFDRSRPAAQAGAASALRSAAEENLRLCEGAFVLHNAAEVHKIVIKTPALDITGWIDLSSIGAWR